MTSGVFGHIYLMNTKIRSIKSYKNIYSCKTVEQVVAIVQALPPRLVKNCMLFVMRKGITPLWEDPKNRQGWVFFV